MKKPKLDSRFWKKVKKTESCWLWIAGLENSGYGNYYLKWPKKVKAHRIVYESIHGFITDPKSIVMHSCDSRICVNPDHLSLGTRILNNLDRDNKGRHKSLLGTAHGMAELSESEVLEIREARKAGVKGVEVAKKYNVSPQTICAIHKRKLWKHL